MMGSILVVVQDPDVRALVSLSLDAHGHEVTVSGDARSTTSTLTERDPDLVVLDIDDPRPSGLDLARALHESDRPARPRILMLTNRGTQREVELGRAAGVDEYVQKPFRVDQLVTQVSRVLAPRTV